MIIEKKVRLSYPKEKLDQPLIYRLIRDYDLMTNILKAHVNEKSGWLVVLIRGDATKIQKGLDWILEQGIKVEVLAEKQEVG